MKLYVRWGSIAKMDELYRSREFLRALLSPNTGNVYNIETDDKERLRELKRVLDSNNIKYAIK